MAFARQSQGPVLRCECAAAAIALVQQRDGLPGPEQMVRIGKLEDGFDRLGFRDKFITAARNSARVRKPAAIGQEERNSQPFL